MTVHCQGCGWSAEGINTDQDLKGVPKDCPVCGAPLSAATDPPAETPDDGCFGDDCVGCPKIGECACYASDDLIDCDDDEEDLDDEPHDDDDCDEE